MKEFTCLGTYLQDAFKITWGTISNLHIIIITIIIIKEALQVWQVSR